MVDTKKMLPFKIPKVQTWDRFKVKKRAATFMEKRLLMFSSLLFLQFYTCIIIKVHEWRGKLNYKLRTVTKSSSGPAKSHLLHLNHYSILLF